jgi:threonine/homoserine/homoserine lactone efflux protein
MPDLPHLLAFIAAGWLLNLTPGPDVLYIVTNSLRSGVRAGIVARARHHGWLLRPHLRGGRRRRHAAGHLGGGLHSAQVRGRGLPAVPRRAHGAVARQAAADLPQAAAATGQRGLKAIFLGGFWTNVLNPKVALFFLAFVPQFIAPAPTTRPLLRAAGRAVQPQLHSHRRGMGLAFAGWMARRGAVQKGMHWLDRAAGVLFIGFGLKLAFTDAPPVRAGH